MPSLRELACEYREALVEFGPDVFSGDECAAIVEELALTDKAARAAVARAAVRAGRCGGYRSRGFAGTQDWLAAAWGSSLHEAQAALEAVRAVESLVETKRKLEAGEVSLAQALEIAKTDAKVPGTEAELLALAQRAGLGPVRARARAMRMAAIPPDELAAEQQVAREFTHWTGDLGMTRGSFALPPAFGIPFVNRLDVETDRIYRAARSRGDHPTRVQCAADAFLRLIEGRGNGRPDRADVVFVLDAKAAMRGHAHEGEVSRILGGSPVPVSTVLHAAASAFIKAVLHDGERIQQVAHYGRRPNAMQRTALMLGLPPEFDGVKCSQPGCERRYGLEFDHIDPVANGGPTSLENLDLPCSAHHREKTERDRRAGRLNGNLTCYQSAEPEERGPP